jgi:hypothetical protein
MSSHRISASGDRPYTLQAGGGAFSGYSVPSKRTDGITFQAGGFERIEMTLPSGVRFERRKVKTRSGAWSELLVLVIDGPESSSPAANVTLYGYPAEDAPDQVGGENTNLDVRKPGEQFGPFTYYAEMEVIEAIQLDALRDEKA